MMALDATQTALFGRYPRYIGTPHQWAVHSEGEMDLAMEVAGGEKNLYASICHLTPDGRPINDKVSIDLDSRQKESAFTAARMEDERFDVMRDDPEIAHEVLGEVIDEAEQVVDWAESHDIPIVTVFSGFGIHLHLLFEDREIASRELTAISMQVKEELSLKTLDRKIVGDVRRLMRIPNCQRVCDGRSTGVWTIPVTPDEIRSWGPSEFLANATGPRDIDLDLPNERPSMDSFFDETYTRDKGQAVSLNRAVVEPDYVPEDLEMYLRKILRMPCMYERIVQPNPGHEVRLNVAVMLFNYGHSVEEVYDIYDRLAWVDWNPEVTKKQLHQIHRRGYSDMSCETIQSAGLCVIEQADRESCATHGWVGGNHTY